MHHSPLSRLYSQETLSAQPSAIRDICALVARPEVRSLAGGWPDAAKFPLAEIGRIFEQMARYFPPQVSWNRPQGGFFIFVHLPQNLDAGELFQQAVGRKVAFVTGRSFFVDGSGHNTLRLSFAQAGKADIKFAVREIGNLIKDRMAGRTLNNAA
jgi:DNA-binding transcriptional MocR family regulator